MSVSSSLTRTSSLYWAPISTFNKHSTNEVLGALSASLLQVDESQNRAWQEEIVVLRKALDGCKGTVHLEYVVPRLGSRIDAVVLLDQVVFVLEFKVGETKYHLAAQNQVWDYALDLKNFHEASHGVPVLPILVATDAPTSDPKWRPPHTDGVRPPLCCNSGELRDALLSGLALSPGDSLDGTLWERSTYRPTPTIVEAARALYQRHSVDDILRNDAEARNLGVTSAAVESVIESSRANNHRSIVFVTGVPGAGKTLVGLNMATKRRDRDEPTHAVFLSGNQPLVSVLQEALVRDEITRLKRSGKEARKGAVRQKIKPFIQIVHHFRDEGLKEATKPPPDRVVIFDEAQRAWNQTKTADFMKRRKNHIGFDQSEPEFLISYMDRHPDWSVIVCLVGGGQEINTGEAGISAWLDAIRNGFHNWRLYLPPNLADSEYRAASAIAGLVDDPRVTWLEDLHLASSMRSFRCGKVSAFVKAVLDCDASAASLLDELLEKYPIALTRDLSSAKKWIREKARGNERFGMVASSEAYRLKPHAIDVRVSVNPVHWFLNDAFDPRSSFFLEDAATEFQVQGLELDWVCVTWDADLRKNQAGWRFHSFRGDNWTKVKKADNQQYLLNTYRVLLTRARQGMVIFVPPGDQEDHTRKPSLYDQTFDYLAKIGIPVV